MQGGVFTPRLGGPEGPPLRPDTTVLSLLLALQLAAASPQAPAASFAVKVEGTGRPMILVPGFASSGEVWTDVVAHYKAKYECHVVTLAGFAGVPAANPTSLARVRDGIVDYIRAKKLDRPVLVGHSLGGFMAMWVASSAPDLAGPVISIDGVPFFSALRNPDAMPDAVRPQAEQIRTFYQTLTTEQIATNNRMAFTSMMSDVSRVEAAMKWGATDGPAAGAMIAEIMTTDIRADVGRIKTPLLLVGAGKSVADSPDRLKAAQQAYEAQVARVPAHEVVMAEKALHFVMYDDLPFLLKTMDGFLVR